MTLLTIVFRLLVPCLLLLAGPALAQGAVASDRVVQPAAGPATVSDPALDYVITARARLQAVQVRQAEWQSQLDARQQAELAAARGARDQEAALHAALRPLAGRSGEADALYDDLVQALGDTRLDLGTALAELRRPLAVPGEAPPVDLTSPYLAGGSDARSLAAAVGGLARSSNQLATAEQELRWQRLDRLTARVRTLNDWRLETLPHLTPAKARETRGYSRQGLAQLDRELDHLWLVTQAHGAVRRHQLATWERHVDVLAAGTIAWRLTELLGLLALAVAVRRRYPAGRRWLRQAALKRARRISVKVVVARWLDVADALLPGLGWLAFLHAAFFLLGNPATEVQVLRTVLLAHGWYRVILATSHHAVSNAVAARLDRVRPELSERIRLSCRLAGRYALVAYVGLALVALALGRGVLYSLVETLAWAGTVPLAVLLMREWRGDIADAFLRTHPESRLAQVVARTREQRLGFFVTVAAFAYVAARGLGFTLRNALWRFEQTRKALAYLFRRQLERQAEEHGHAAGDVGLLPPELVAAFTTGTPAQTIAHFPRLAEVAELVARWQAGRGGAAVAVTGPAGIGKTTWLGELVRTTTGDAVWLSPERRIVDRHGLAALLAGALGLAADADLPAIRTALRDGPPRLIVVDRCECLLVRAVGGLDVYRAFVELVEQTVGQTVWVCAFDRYAWDFADRLKLGSSHFTRTVILPAWGEEAIGQLIDQRMTAAGYLADYTDLLLDRQENRAVPRELPRTIERYRNLLWDYADGNPRLAMHFWLRSLLPGSGDRVRVRLFRAPLADEVEILDEQARFVLACVVNHGGMTVAEAARSLRFSGAFCEAALTRLHLGGILDRQDGLYRLSTHWQEAVLVYLRRKHLLFD